MILTGMSTMVVIPPAAAAVVAVSKPSQSVLSPGSLTWTWLSTMPGINTREPQSTTVRIEKELGRDGKSIRQQLREFRALQRSVP